MAAGDTAELYANTSGQVHEYAQIAKLDGQEYEVRLRWNMRTETWYVSVYTLAGDPVVQGRAVVCGANLLRGATAASTPTGALLAAPLDGHVEHPTLTELGGRVRLWYVAAT